MTWTALIGEEHMTFVSTSGYISHETLESKKSAAVSKKIIKTIDDTNSRNSLKILAVDGEAVNTGAHTGTVSPFLFFCMHLSLVVDEHCSSTTCYCIYYAMRWN